MERNPRKQARPLYWRVADDIVARIDARIWAPNSRLPSERVLCEQYGVSQITVRRALRELAHLGRVNSRHGVGWFVAENHPEPLTVDSSQRQVDVILDELDWVSTPILSRLARVLGANGAPLTLTVTQSDRETRNRAFAAAIDRHASAILLVVSGKEADVAETCRQFLLGTDVPALLLLRDVEGIDRPVAMLDEQTCLEKVTRHMLSLGHRHVAYAGLDPSLMEGQRRYWGFARTLWERGLELPLDWVFSSSLTDSAEAERFREIMHGSAAPTALVCASDTRAAEALSLLQGMGLGCPEDLAIAGLGDRDFGRFLSVPLTSIRFDLDGLGKAAAGMTLDLLAGRQVRSVSFGGDLVVRRSCGAGARQGSQSTR